ncbi:MAG: F0F1 ATP synthase subunit epsilon [Hyphomicrobiales bacterium]|nr:MAG: F0F1 ATP synthase subunit epsilon [Hyphomicrobiales bacterium]
MAEAFQFDLVSPERLVISEAVEQVVVPGMEGDFGVLKNHAPFMSTIRPGFIQVTTTDGKTSKIFVRGGFADTNPTGLTILAEQAIPIDELKTEHLDEAIKEAEDDIANAMLEETKTAAAHKLGLLQDIREALSRL